MPSISSGADVYSSLRWSAARGFGAAMVGASGCALALNPWLNTSPLSAASLAFKAGALPAVLAAVVGPSLRTHGKPTLGPANRITLFRAALVGFSAAFVGEPRAAELIWVLLLVNCLAFGLDWVDGRVARATGSSSPFGARLDMELDALTVVVLCAQVWSLGRAGGWVMASGAMRYGFVAAGWIWPWMERQTYATPRRAWICGVQVVCLLAALIPWPAALDGLSAAFAAFGLVALTWSFGLDIGWLFARRSEPLA